MIGTSVQSLVLSFCLVVRIGGRGSGGSGRVAGPGSLLLGRRVGGVCRSGRGRAVYRGRVESGHCEVRMNE